VNRAGLVGVIVIKRQRPQVRLYVGRMA